MLMIFFVFYACFFFKKEGLLVYWYSSPKIYHSKWNFEEHFDFGTQSKTDVLKCLCDNKINISSW